MKLSDPVVRTCPSFAIRWLGAPRIFWLLMTQFIATYAPVPAESPTTPE